MFLVMFKVSEWARTVVEILDLKNQNYVSIKNSILYFIAQNIVNMHPLSDVLCFSKHR